MTKTIESKPWPSAFKSRFPYFVIAAMAITLQLTGNLSLLDNKLADLGFQIGGRSATGDVVLVEIDAKSIEALQSWPWPRGYHAQVLDRLIAAGASKVAFDIDFSAFSRLEEDKKLEEALARASGKVILPSLGRLSESADGQLTVKRALPIPAFRPHVTLASVNVRPDSDGLIRRMLTLDGSAPTFAALLSNQTDAPFSSFLIDYGIRPSTIPRLSFVDVMLSNFDTSQVSGKKILIGSTAIELGDQLAVPLYRSIPGPLLHILGYESLIQGRALFGVAAAPTAIAIVLFTVLLGPFFRKWSWKWGLVGLTGTILGLIATSLALQIGASVLINVIPIALSTVLLFSFSVIRRIDQQAVRLVFQNLDIRRKDLMMRSIVQNSFDGIVTISTDGVIEAINPAGGKILGTLEGNIEGRKIDEFLPALRGSSDTENLISILRVGMAPHELEARRINGETLPIELSVSYVDTDDHCVFTIFFRDITDRKRQREKLVHQANHDALTGLPNRKLFYERLQETVASADTRGTSLAVLLLDLDRFKEVNDTLGHPTGDQLLKKISQRLQETIPASDTIARIGGDEFALLLPSTDTAEAAAELARRVLAAIREPFDLAGLTLEISGSVGIAMYPEHGRDEADLVKRADVAMYMAKTDQTNIAIYDEEKDLNSVRFLTLTGDLRRAIEEEQLVLYYQPKICLKQNRIIAVEALIRWIHPEHGFIPPDDVIDKAEQTGVIGPMTEWVIDTAFKQAAEWRRRGIDIGIAVNISARLLGDFEIEKMVKESLEKWQVPAGSVILEVTENALMSDPAKAMEVITALSNTGARISIDDFGTGYSSLGYLKDLPADELKIDKCFVQSVLEDKSNETIVRSTVGLAHALGLKVVAEGIETEDICALLAGIDCDVGQGYLFSKPLPVLEFDEWLTTSPWGLPSISAQTTRAIVKEDVLSVA